LVVPRRNKPIECGPRFDTDRHALLPGQAHDLPELPIGSQDKETLERANPGAERLTHSVEAVDHLLGIIVSIDWCHRADPQS
jgi:hypothetical protein